MTDETDQTPTLEVPKEAPEHQEYDIEGTGYEPGAAVVLLIEHSPSGWHRRRDIQADEEGKISLHSNAYETPGTMSVRVLSTGENAGVLATGKIKIVPFVPDDAPGDGPDDHEGGSVANPSDTSETDSE